MAGVFDEKKNRYREAFQEVGHGGRGSPFGGRRARGRGKKSGG
jgi:hypothetical protein